MPSKTIIEWGPFKGMRYSFDPADDGERRQYVYEALNMVPVDPEHGGAYIRRFGDNRDTIAASSLAGQWIGVFKKRSGFLNVGVFSGQIYTYLSGSGWTLSVTTANLGSAGITLSSTAVCYAESFNNLYVINDGTNQPFIWNGVAGASGLTLLSNTPTKCFGMPVIYYGKLFFIKDVAANGVDRSTIVWSEENAPNTGYEAGGYNNVWTLEQSGSGAIYALCATNRGLYFFRARGIGVISGAVTPAFTTSGVHDGVSSQHGTTQAAGVINIDEEIYFLDTQNCEPCVITDTRVRQLGRDIQDHWSQRNQILSSGSIGNTVGRIVAFPILNAFAFTYQMAGSIIGVYIFSTHTKRCMSRWTYEVNLTNDVTGTPLIGTVYDAGHDVMGIAGFAVSAGSSYSYITPPHGAATWYSASNPPATFRLTLSPYVAPSFGVLQPQAVETMFDVNSATSGTTSTITVSRRTQATLLADGTTTTLATTSLTTLTSASVASNRQEIRSHMTFNERLRNFQLLYEDTGTLRNYAWGVKRVGVLGDLQPAESGVT